MIFHMEIFVTYFRRGLWDAPISGPLGQRSHHRAALLLLLLQRHRGHWYRCHPDPRNEAQHSALVKGHRVTGNGVNGIHR